MSKDAVILVVDDEREHADGIAEALEKNCAKAIAVYNAKDALEILRIRLTDAEMEDIIPTEFQKIRQRDLQEYVSELG